MLLLVTINPVLVLRIPPSEFLAAISKAGLPGFESFTLIFDAHRHLATPILYIEVALILATMAAYSGLRRGKGPQEASAGQIKALAQTAPAAQEK